MPSCHFVRSGRGKKPRGRNKASSCRNVLLCSPRPACAHPSPGGFAGALAGGGAPGRHPLICRCSESVSNMQFAVNSIVGFHRSCRYCRLPTADCSLVLPRGREPPPRQPQLAPRPMRLLISSSLVAPTFHVLAWLSTGVYHAQSWGPMIKG